MKRETLLGIVGREPFFTTGMLLSSGTDLRDVHKQLSRWKLDGTVIQLRRGLYALGRPYRRAEPNAYELSNALQGGSYVSLESALSDYGLIPEAVFVTTAATTGRSGSRKTPFGTFVYQHIKPSLFWGYEAVTLPGDRTAFVATREKALLDMAYLRVGSSDPAFVRALRLQHLETVDLERLADLAKRSGSPKVRAFADIVRDIAGQEADEYEEL